MNIINKKTRTKRLASRRLNRAGDLFMLGVDMFFLIAIILVFWKVSGAFTQTNSNEGIGTSQSALLYTYSASEKMLLYIDVAAQSAAYESVHTLSSKGGSGKDDLGCGLYANYVKWTTDGKSCLDQDIMQEYKQEFKKNFKAMLAYPNMPSSMAYDIAVSSGRIIGKTKDNIALAVVTNKDGPESDLGTLLLSQNLAQVSRAGFTQDSYLVSQVTPSLNYKPRVLKASRILITSTQTDDLALAITKYTDGTSSPHYLIDQEGKIIQLVQEDFDSALNSCKDQSSSTTASEGSIDCKIKDIDDTSISIALVNPESVAAEEGNSDLGSISSVNNAAKNNLCAMRDYEYSGDYEPPQCFAPYTQAQLDSLTSLVMDIAKRRSIKQSDIIFEDDVTDEIAPGPALHSQGMTRAQWTADFMKRVAAGIAQSVAQDNSKDNSQFSNQKSSQTTQAIASQTTASAALVSSADLSVGLPLKDPSLLSCFGYRELSSKGQDFHDGIDLASDDGNVYAIADGVVYDTCEKWVGECDCSIAPGAKNRCTSSCDTSSSMCHNYGNTVVIQHPQSNLYSRYSHLDSIDSSIKKGAAVKSGQKIGVKGSTGYSEGPHLDLKIYNDPSQIEKQDKSVNPLCYLPDSLLSKIKISSSANSCSKYSGKLSHDNPVLANECKGITVLSAKPGCGFDVTLPKSSDNKQVQATLTNINKVTGLAEEIQKSGKNNDIDPRLIIAVITQESVGDPKAVSDSGCVGIAQFCSGTAKMYQDIFGSGIQSCSSPNDCSKYPNDPRFDPIKSVRAEAKLLSSNMQAFRKYTAKNEFTIASYNGGSGAVLAAIKKTGKQDPTWEEVKAVFDESIIAQTYPHDASYNRYFATEDQRKSKVKQITGYVSKVGAYFASQGGQIGALGDVNCGDTATVTAKQLGVYTFNPSFNVELPSNPIAQAISFATDAYKDCNGKDGISNGECIKQKINSFNSKQGGFAISPIDAPNICEGDAGAIANGFSEFVTDCAANMQSNCTCEFNINKGGLGSNDKVDILLYANYGRVYVSDAAYNDASGDPRGYVKSSADSIVEVKKVQLTQYGNGKKAIGLLPLSSQDTKFDSGAVVKSFKLLKTDPSESTIPMVWLAYDDSKYPACGAYKTTYPICLQSKELIYNKDDMKKEYPKVKFSLYLDDRTKPTPPSNLVANPDYSSTGSADAASAPASGLIVTFSASDSKDVSYYNVSCKKDLSSTANGMSGLQDMVSTSIGAPEAQAIQSSVQPTQHSSGSLGGAAGAIRLFAKDSLKIELHDCEGERIDTRNAYDVIVIPIDMQGNVGDAAIVKTEQFKESTKDSQSASGSSDGDQSS